MPVGLLRRSRIAQILSHNIVHNRVHLESYRHRLNMHAALLQKTWQCRRSLARAGYLDLTLSATPRLCRPSSAVCISICAVPCSCAAASEKR